MDTNDAWIQLRQVVSEAKAAFPNGEWDSIVPSISKHLDIPDRFDADLDTVALADPDVTTVIVEPIPSAYQQVG